MARLSDLIPYAEKHNLKIATIADLIAYRLKNDHVVEKVMSQPFHSIHGGDFTMTIYRSELDGTEHVALSCGDVASGGPVLVRMHAWIFSPMLWVIQRKARQGSCNARYRPLPMKGAARLW
jgi:3,4-dihydroxy 2-butanone 4-phosphate synthase/GTP cyclohydrolase II